MSQFAHNHDHDHDHSCQVPDLGQPEGYIIPEYDNRELIVREDILARAKELAQLITTAEEVEMYQNAERLIQRHEKVQGLIAQIKKKQKELVAFQTTFKNAQMVEKIEQEISVLQDELDGMPVVQQFQQSQTDVNYLLQSIVSIIRDTVAEKLDVEAAKPIEAPEECD
ncbi:RicAFT regulatory complex protein RicA family protein [Cohnella sp. REN36]|uniref:RicAFT regulatory complex protein RicA family protein n=1 Tax=Cohnella sp. REN36 TaxID=2887347 RepID=UPI001D157222|nr:YlbF family regulator [Cohnella sp. REN36]MCC3371786.1 YlbF family regulator [Cohnella sp. REN36]